MLRVSTQVIADESQWDHNTLQNAPQQRKNTTRVPQFYAICWLRKCQFDHDFVERPCRLALPTTLITEDSRTKIVI